MIAPPATSASVSLEWDAAMTPMPGESILGDRAVVAVANERMLIAVIDGVGHGAEAATAAEVAVNTLRHLAEQDVASAVRECHRVLADTRGAAVSLASVNGRDHTVTWLGVGNVESRLLHGAGPVPLSESLLLHNGIVGHDLPRLTPRTMPVARGDLVIFATDGIRRDFADGLMPRGTCRDIADHILAEHLVGSDDALVLVARYLGGQ